MDEYACSIVLLMIIDNFRVWRTEQGGVGQPLPRRLSCSLAFVVGLLFIIGQGVILDANYVLISFWRDHLTYCCCTWTTPGPVQINIELLYFNGGWDIASCLDTPLGWVGGLFVESCRQVAGLFDAAAVMQWAVSKNCTELVEPGQYILWMSTQLCMHWELGAR